MKRLIQESLSIHQIFFLKTRVYTQSFEKKTKMLGYLNSYHVLVLINKLSIRVSVYTYLLMNNIHTS